MTSQRRMFAPLGEDIDSNAWVLEDPVFRQWQQGDSRHVLFIHGESGWRTSSLAYSISFLAETQNRERENPERELYLMYDFNRCDAHLDLEQSFFASLVYQCLTLRPLLFRNTRAKCKLISDLRTQTVSSDQLLSLLCWLLSAADDQRVYLVIVAMDQFQMDSKTRNIAIYKKVLKLFDDHILSSKLRILATARTSLGAEFPESLHITLNSEKSVSAAEMHELLQSNLKNFDMIKEALNWVVHATRPLTLSELSVAIALSRVQKESGTSGPDSQTDNYMMELLEEYMSFDLQKDLQLIIGKAIKVAGSKGNVHLIHDSLRKCFESWEGLYILGFHKLITQACLSYMCGVLKHGEERSSNSQNRSRVLVFLDYAKLNWTEHYKLVTDSDPALNFAAAEFILGECGRLWYEILAQNNDKILDAIHRRPLVMAAERKFTHLLKTLKSSGKFSRDDFDKNLELKAPLQASIWHNDSDTLGKILVTLWPVPPFLWRWVKLAAEYGRTELALSMLSGLGEAKIETPVETTGSLCLIAAKNGHLGTLESLLNHIPSRQAHLQTDDLDRTIVHWAAAWGDADCLSKLHKRDLVLPCIPLTDHHGETVLHLAAASGSVQATELLLGFEKGLVNMRDGGNFTPLQRASREGHEAVVKVLVQAGADVWARTGDAEYPWCGLELAARVGHLPLFSLLLGEMEKGLLQGKRDSGQCKFDAKSGDFDQDREAILKALLLYSFKEAIQAGHGHIIRSICSRSGEDIRTLVTDNFEWFLADHYHCHTAQALAEGMGQIPTAVAHSLLRIGIGAGSVGVVKCLLKFASEETITAFRTQRGETNVLHWTAVCGNLPVMRLLLLELPNNSKHELLYALDEDGLQAIDIAIKDDNVAVVKELVGQMREGLRRPETIFHAELPEQVPIVKLLLENGWESASDNNGKTLLHMAASTGQIEMVKLLLEKTKDLLNKFDDDGHTPLALAKANNYRDIEEILVDRGAH